MNFLSTLLTIARPRFWPYLAGPWVIGWLASSAVVTDLLSPVFWGGLLFFLWPANFFVYGINDWSDQDTDIFNAKKKGYETAYQSQYHMWVMGLIATVSLVGAVGSFLIESWQGLFLYLGWWFLCCGYSVPPFRFKARPFLDSWSNVLYVFPGVMAYFFQAGFDSVAWVLVLAASCWAMGMHLFSALPDITADAKAKVITTAVYVGFKAATVLTGIYFLLAGVLVALYWNMYLGSIATILYVGIVIYTYVFAQSQHVFRVYKIFPLINTTMGFVLFWTIFYLQSWL